MRLSRPVNVCNEHMESMTNQFKIRAQRHPRECLGVQNEPRGAPDASRRRPRVKNKRPGDVQGVQHEPRGVPEASRASKMSPQASQRHPEVAQEYQRSVEEASRRRPRVSKKLPEGAKVDLVVFYSSKWDPEGIPEASRASKMSPNASQRRPEDAQECQRSDQEAQNSI